MCIVMVLHIMFFVLLTLAPLLCGVRYSRISLYYRLHSIAAFGIFILPSVLCLRCFLVVNARSAFTGTRYGFSGYVISELP